MGLDQSKDYCCAVKHNSKTKNNPKGDFSVSLILPDHSRKKRCIFEVLAGTNRLPFTFFLRPRPSGWNRYCFCCAEQRRSFGSRFSSNWRFSGETGQQPGQNEFSVGIVQMRPFIAF
jgi:hypothetical protein